MCDGWRWGLGSLEPNLVPMVGGCRAGGLGGWGLGVGVFRVRVWVVGGGWG